MKNLNEYCKSIVKNKWKYKLPNVNGYRTFTEFCDINNFTEDTVTDDAIDFYYQYNINGNFNRYNIDFSNLINEGLKSYDSNKLIDKLNKEFNNEIISIKPLIQNNNSKCVPVILDMKYKNNIIDDSTFDKKQWDYLSNNSLKNTDDAKKI